MRTLVRPPLRPFSSHRSWGSIRFPPRRQLFTAHDHGQLRSDWSPILAPCHPYASNERPACDPIDDFPGSSPHIEQKLAETLEVSPQRNDGFVQRKLATLPLNFWTVFSGLACLPGARLRRDCRLPCHVATTCPCGQPNFLSCFVRHKKHSPRRLDGAAIKRAFVLKVLADTQIRDPHKHSFNIAC